MIMINNVNEKIGKNKLTANLRCERLNKTKTIIFILAMLGISISLGAFLLSEGEKDDPCIK